MQNKFQNLKISITDKVHLKAVCDVLGSMGYKRERYFFLEENPVLTHVLTWENAVYQVVHEGAALHRREATLTDLLQMRDKYFKEAIK